MYLSELPPTDLKKLYKDVIEGPPSSGLPQNLKGKWLRSIARDIAFLLKKYPTWMSDNPIENLAGPSMYLAGPTMVLLKLMNDFEGRILSKKEVARYDMQKCIMNYWDCLVAEIIRREIGVSFSNTTLQTIFSPSNVSR